MTKKRKHKDKGNSNSKRRRISSSDDEDDDLIVSDDVSDDAGSNISDSSDELDDDSSSGGVPGLESDEIEPVTEETLKAKIKEGKEKIKDIRAILTVAREKKKDASDKLARLKKSLAKVQREKNGFCSLKRSEVSDLVCLEVIGQ